MSKKLESKLPVGQPRLVRLLPCPFCGKTPKVAWHESYGGSKIRVIYCHWNKCHIKPSVRVAKRVGMKDADARSESAKRWNHRHKETLEELDARDMQEHVCAMNRDMMGKCFVCGSSSLPNDQVELPPNG